MAAAVLAGSGWSDPTANEPDEYGEKQKGQGQYGLHEQSEHHQEAELDRLTERHGHAVVKGVVDGLHMASENGNSFAGAESAERQRTQAEGVMVDGARRKRCDAPMAARAAISCINSVRPVPTRARKTASSSNPVRCGGRKERGARGLGEEFHSHGFQRGNQETTGDCQSPFK